MFSCFCSMKKESSRPTRDSNSWSLNQESNALPTELAGLGERNALCFLLLIWTFFQFFSTLTILPLIVILSWWRLSTHSFHVFLLLVLWKGRVLDPQGTRTLCRWNQKSNALRISLLMTFDWVSGSGREECTLFPVVNLNVLSIFFDSYNFAAHRNSFLMTFVYSQFSCFPASSSLKKESSRPIRDSNPLSLNQKSNALPTELAGLGERNALCFLLLNLNVLSGREECTLFPVVNLNVLSRFFDSYTSAAHCNSSLMTIVYSQFSCFHASSSMKKESSRPTRDSNSWSLNQESNALPTELAGLGERNALCFLLLIWTFFQFFSTLTILPLIVILSWWRLSTHSFHVFLLLVLWKRRVLDP